MRKLITERRRLSITESVALGLSLTVEAVVAALATTLFQWGSGWRTAAAAITGTLMTHHLAWRTIVATAEPHTYWAVVSLVETGVVLVEAIVYRLFGMEIRRAFALSTLANASSICCGMVFGLILS